ncbi:uncharacterized protein SPSK_03813 [Sporothrix schenckii 1099-18]|uniref:Uncharacterized protein n=1 Tax=Sporothrix schenckii 1099-18 TaxID=1397361 RepID=A0A0F2M1A8_SPOSC|nr:uncharacterized protein SPSK_03813 [Sporothrix schenckii 1099-18]KJR82540.1 hypothetical protein SPSK_03813 [Sporothrix schenckii 1099-18]
MVEVGERGRDAVRSRAGRCDVRWARTAGEAGTMATGAWIVSPEPTMGFGWLNGAQKKIKAAEGGPREKERREQ